MKAQVFDGITRELCETATRRSFFRLLGGAATVGAGLALTARDESLGKARGKSKGQARGEGRDQARESITAQRRGGRKKITICHNNQTRTIKKSKLGNYRGAVRGACEQQAACTTWIISGGPNQSDRIVADDDFSIYFNGTSTEIIDDDDRKASSVSPVVFNAPVGQVLKIVAYDAGGCRSLSPLWLHCAATGQKRQLVAGYNGGTCTYPAGVFFEQNVTVSL